MSNKPKNMTQPHLWPKKRKNGGGFKNTSKKSEML